MERILDEISFTAPDRAGEEIVIDADHVQEHIGELAKNTDLSRSSFNENGKAAPMPQAWRLV
jgi:ATP-dependent protease HslVU (ClpYQ) ATPase subunit